MGENMKKFITLKLRFWKVFTALLCLVSIILIFIKPKEINSSVRSGITLCGEIIIPSLFPFTIVSIFMFKSGIISNICKIISPITKVLFKLDETTFGVYLLSLIAGYPVGAKLINELHKNKIISSKKAENMLYYCVNGGPAFIVIAVGLGLLNNKQIGLILLFSHILSSLIICFIIARFENFEDSNHNNIKKTNLISAFVESTADATTSMFSICSWVILFSVVSVVIELLVKNQEINTILSCLFEVTTGINKLSKIGTVSAISLTLGLSGICVHMQVISSIKNIRISYLPFFIVKFINGILSSIITSITLRLCPVTVATFSSFSKNDLKINSGSFPLFFALMLTSISFFTFYKSERIR